MKDQELERPSELWDGLTWRGPRGTCIDAWCREITAISKAIQEREDRLHQSTGGKHRTPQMVNWRLDCLADLLQTLEHNRRTL